MTTRDVKVAFLTRARTLPLCRGERDARTGGP